jgi:hypothetical protein
LFLSDAKSRTIVQRLRGFSVIIGLPNTNPIRYPVFLFDFILFLSYQLLNRLHFRFSDTIRQFILSKEAISQKEVNQDNFLRRTNEKTKFEVTKPSAMLYSESNFFKELFDNHESKIDCFELLKMF